MMFRLLELGNGKLTYENFSPSAQDPQRPPTAAQAAARPCRLALCSVALLGAGLVLLAACVGLGIRYGQVWQELQRASRRQEAESSCLAGNISGQERNLTRARADLDATRRALWRSWQAGNDTRRQLERELRAARSNLALLQREKDGATRQLQEAASCRQIGCCPPGWKLFRWRCLWVSGKWETWKWSKQNCKNKRAQVLMLKSWDAATVLDATGERDRLQAIELWIGLAAKRSKGQWAWSWTDGSRYESENKPPVASTYKESSACATLKQGQLSGGTCYKKWRRYICEKAASPDPLPDRLA